jgi:hypothetical protein
MNSLIEQIEMWITNLIDARIDNAIEIALARPGNIEEISEARVMELINDQVISDDRLQEQIATLLNGNSPGDLGLNMDYYLCEDSDLTCYLDLHEFMTKDDVRGIIEDATIIIDVN